MNMHMAPMIRAAILGASGYVGGELMRLIAAHPDLEVAVPFGAFNAGQPVDSVHPHLGLAYPDRIFAEWESGALAGSDLIFAALPHGETQRLAEPILSHGVPFVDLGADFRLDTADDFADWYGEPHQRPDLLESFVYGLPEVYRDRIAASSRVAAPGCYPTAANLALKPLIDASAVWLPIAPARVVVPLPASVSAWAPSTRPRFRSVPVRVTGAASRTAPP